MATLGDKLNLVDVATRLDPNGAVPMIAELMAKTNEVLPDIPWVQGNLPTGHKTTVRTGLPTPTWRRLNEGVLPTKSKTVPQTDTCGLLEDYGQIDKDLVTLNGNSKEFRLSEDVAHIEGINQEFSSSLFYANTATAEEEILGLAPRYSTISTDDTESGYNIIDAGGTGADNTSIWLVGWSPQTVFGIYPKGSNAGLSFEDLGKVTAVGSSGEMHEVYRSHYQWKCGLCVKDWRYAVRVANIDHSNMVAESSAADLIKVMIKALYRIPSRNMGKLCFYVNEDVMTYLDIQTMAASNLHLSYKDVHGHPVLTFRGVPIRKCEALLNTEAQIT